MLLGTKQASRGLHQFRLGCRADILWAPHTIVPAELRLFPLTTLTLVTAAGKKPRGFRTSDFTVIFYLVLPHLLMDVVIICRRSVNTIRLQARAKEAMME